MWSSLENIQPSKRPPNQSVFPDARVYFQRWVWFRWFLLLLLPVAQSACVAVWRGQIYPACFIAISGATIATFLFIDLASGATSSNWGTYFRSSEPLRYWLSVMVFAVAYVGISVAGWYVTYGGRAA